MPSARTGRAAGHHRSLTRHLHVARCFSSVGVLPHQQLKAEKHREQAPRQRHGRPRERLVARRLVRRRRGCFANSKRGTSQWVSRGARAPRGATRAAVGVPTVYYRSRKFLLVLVVRILVVLYSVLVVLYPGSYTCVYTQTGYFPYSTYSYSEYVESSVH